MVSTFFSEGKQYKDK